VVVESTLTPTAEAAHLVLPLRAFAEKDGTFVAGNGVVQHLKAALASRATVPPLRATLTAIAAGLGRDVAFDSTESPRKPRWSPPERPSAALVPRAGTARCLHLRWSPLVDHRVRIVPEADRIFPGPALEVHPGDLAGLGLASGGTARIVSGKAEVVVAVRADWRTAPGQLYLPLDPRDAQLAEFARVADRSPDWPYACVRLTRIEPAGPAAGEGRS